MAHGGAKAAHECDTSVLPLEKKISQHVSIFLSNHPPPSVSIDCSSLMSFENRTAGLNTLEMNQSVARAMCLWRTELLVVLQSFLWAYISYPY